PSRTAGATAGWSGRPTRSRGSTRTISSWRPRSTVCLDIAARRRLCCVMRRSLAVAAVLLATVPVTARAVDVPVSGYRLILRGPGRTDIQPKRSMKLIVKDPALTAPLPDPRGGTLLINGGALPGQCQAETYLETLFWRQLDDGGWRYTPGASGIDGIQRIDLRPGLLRITVRGYL